MNADSNIDNNAGAQCPLPISDYPKVLMAHGGGGRLMNQLIEKMFVDTFNNSFLNEKHDGARLSFGEQEIAFTTDSYVVRPLFFPGGDIGSLAVNGTVNDLAMCGARPQFISAGFIIEEGLDMNVLWQVTQSMKQAADAAGVQLVTGDTKVVDKGKGDGLFINTSGIGKIESPSPVSPANVRAGDVIILNGDIGRHGMAVMAVREGLSFESQIKSDCAPLSGLVMDLLSAGIEIHCMRDLTRGGLASALVEIASASNTQIEIDENEIRVREDVRGACEILGLDPIYVANEGRFVSFIPKDDVNQALELMIKHPMGTGAKIIGQVTQTGPGSVSMKSKIGALRVVDMLSGEQLPRIC